MKNNEIEEIQIRRVPKLSNGRLMLCAFKNDGTCIGSSACYNDCEHNFSKRPLINKDYINCGKANEAFANIDEKQAKDKEIRPVYYNRYSVETIDMMERVFGPEAMANFCEINAFKYRIRMGEKDDITDDLKKERYYLERAKYYRDKIKPTIVAVNGNTTTIERMIEPKFPNWETVVPKDGESVTVDAGDLKSSLKRLMVLSNKTTKQVILERDVNGIRISAEDPDYGNTETEVIPGTCPDGFRIAVNGEYLSEILSICGDECELKFTAENLVMPIMI